jgi:TetR/AcrR family transcriptional regulator, mexJK operon transcriptional repressor
MDSAVPRKFTSDERRNHILDIAHAAFIREGYAGTSMARIAALLGGSKTTLYHHFSSKKELFVAVADRECAKLFDNIFVATEIAGDFQGRVRELARRLLASMLSDDMIASYRLIVAESGRFPEIGHAAHDIALRRGTQHLAVVFKRAMESGEMRVVNPKMAAEQFLDLTSGTLHKMRLWNVVPSIDADRMAIEAKRIATTFLAAFGNDAFSRAARESSDY